MHCFTKLFLSNGAAGTKNFATSSLDEVTSGFDGTVAAQTRPRSSVYGVFAVHGITCNENSFAVPSRKIDVRVQSKLCCPKAMHETCWCNDVLLNQIRCRQEELCSFTTGHGYASVPRNRYGSKTPNYMYRVARYSCCFNSHAKQSTILHSSTWLRPFCMERMCFVNSTHHASITNAAAWRHLSPTSPQLPTPRHPTNSYRIPWSRFGSCSTNCEKFLKDSLRPNSFQMCSLRGTANTR